jgi:regulator of nucleoside diphosphate kinase
VELDLYRLDEPPMPPITLKESDAERVYSIAMAAMLRNPRSAAGLLDELNRAIVVPDEHASADVAGIGSIVEFVDHRVSPERLTRVQLVMPEDAKGSDKLSILSDFGAALIGLAPGQSIVWPDRRGGTERLTVVRVRSPEALPASETSAPRRTALGWRRR